METQYLSLLKSRSLKKSNQNDLKIVPHSLCYSSYLKEALDNFYLERLLLESGACSVCQEKSLKICTDCGVKFCSVKCQKSGAENSPLSESSHFHSNTVEVLNDSSTIELTDETDWNDGSSNAEEKNESRHENRNFSYKKFINTQNKVNNKKPVYRKQNNVFKCRSSSRNDQDLSYTTHKNEFIKGSVIQVTVVSYTKQKNLFWVIPCQNEERINEINNILFKEIKNCETVEPTPGLECALKQGNAWYRVKIIKTEPKLIVRCLDKATVMVTSTNIVKKLPDNLVNFPPQATLMEFVSVLPDKSQLPYKVFVEVLNNSQYNKPVVRIQLSEESKNNRVDVEDIDKHETERKRRDKVYDVQPKNQTSLMQSYIKNIFYSSERACTFDELKNENCGIFTIKQEDSEFYYISLVPDGDTDAAECEELLSTFTCPKQNLSRAPNYGLVAISTENVHGYRAQIVSSTSSTDENYIVYLLDYGYIIGVSNVYELPKNYQKLKDLGCRMRKVDGYPKLQEGVTYFYTVNTEEKTSDVEHGGIPLRVFKDLEDEENYLVFYVERCVKDVKKLSETSQNVIITCFNQLERCLYVRTEDQHKTYEMMTKKIKTSCLEKYSGQLGEKALALITSKYVRVLVSEEAKMDSYSVHCIDTGKIVVVKKSSLFALPEDMKGIEPLARKVYLKDYDRKISKAELNVIKFHIVNKTNFILTFDDENEKYAKMSFFYCDLDLAEFLNTISGTMTEEDDSSPSETEIDQAQKTTDHVTHDNKGKPVALTTKLLESAALPKGNYQRFCPLHVDEKEFKSDGVFWGANSENEYFRGVMQNLLPKIKKYCEENDDVDYTPRVGDRCFAVFEGEWYRGKIERKNDNLFTVFFVDFGNKADIKAELIKKMVPSYFETPATAVKCIINGFKDLTPDALENILKFLYNKLNGIMEIEVVEQTNDCSFVNIPINY